MSSSVKPLSNNIIVEYPVLDIKTPGGLILELNAKAPHPVVMEVGPTVTEVKPGDTVAVNINALRVLEVEGREYFKINVGEVYAIITTKTE